MSFVRARDGVLLACGAAALVAHTILNQVQGRALRAALGPAPVGVAFGEEYWQRLMAESQRMLYQRLAIELALVAGLVVASFALRRFAAGLRLGAAAAVVVFLCATFAISLRFVVWNVPFWLAAAGVAAHFTKKPVARNALLELAALGANAIYLGPLSMPMLQ